MNKLYELLDVIENRIDVEREEKTVAKTKAVLRFQDTEKPCLMIGGIGESDFKQVSTQATHEDMELMLYNQLIPVLNGIGCESDRCYSVRANYGVGTLASIFGAKSGFTNEWQMPWCTHLEKDEIRNILANGKFDIKKGFGQKVIDTYEFYAEVLSKYPKTQAVVKMFHADLQGPMDSTHLIYGSDIYYDMYDEPELVHGLLSLVTDAYIEHMKKQKEIINDETEEFCYHWNTLYRGKVLLRDDTAVNLSPDMYDEFIKPYNERILKAFGEGSMHYCGERQSWLPNMLEQTENLYAINFGVVPGLAYGLDFLEYVASITAPQKKNIISYQCKSIEEYKEAIKRGLGRGVVFNQWVSSEEEAEQFRSVCN